MRRKRSKRKQMDDYSQRITNCQNKKLTQSHINIQNRLFLFPPWVCSIPTIPSMTLPRKNSKGGCKRRKRSAGQDCKCLSIGAPCKLLEQSFQCSFVKDCNKTLRNFCFCILFAKFAHRTPNFIQNDLEQWIIRIITA